MASSNRYLFLLSIGALILMCGEAAAGPVLYAWGSYPEGSVGGSQTYVIDPIAATVLAVQGAGGGSGTGIVAGGGTGGTVSSSGTGTLGSSAGGDSGGLGGLDVGASGSGSSTSQSTTAPSGSLLPVGGTSLPSAGAGDTTDPTLTATGPNATLEELLNAPAESDGDPNRSPGANGEPPFVPGSLAFTPGSGFSPLGVTPTAVAEPAPLGLLGIALAVLGMTLRRKAH